MGTAAARASGQGFLPPWGQDRASSAEELALELGLEESPAGARSTPGLEPEAHAYACSSSTVCPRWGLGPVNGAPFPGVGLSFTSSFTESLACHFSRTLLFSVHSGYPGSSQSLWGGCSCSSPTTLREPRLDMVSVTQEVAESIRVLSKGITGG